MWAQPRCPAASGHRAVTTSRVTHLNVVPRTAVQTRGGASCAGLGGRRLGMSLDALRGTSSMARRGIRPTSGRRRATYALASSDTEWGGLSIPDTMPALVERGGEKPFFPPVGVADDPTVANPLLRQQMLSTEWFGCVFDLEGVLIKPRYQEHRSSWVKLAEEREEPAPPEMVLKYCDTMKPEDFISRQLRWTRDPMEMRRINQRRGEIYKELLAESADGGKPELLEGVLPFLELMKGNKVPMAVICNALLFSEMCELLKGLQIYEFFEHDQPGEPHVVAGEDVSDWLPDPLPIERACMLMGRPPRRTVVFGNTTNVTEACIEAKAKSVILLGRQPRYELQGADTVVTKLTDLTVANLKRLFTEEESEAAEPQKQVEIFPTAGGGAQAMTMEEEPDYNQWTDSDDSGGRDTPDYLRRRKRRDI